MREEEHHSTHSLGSPDAQAESKRQHQAALEFLKHDENEFLLIVNDRAAKKLVGIICASNVTLRRMLPEVIRAGTKIVEFCGCTADDVQEVFDKLRPDDSPTHRAGGWEV